MSASAFRRALEEGDLKALRGIWAKAAPHLPQPQNDEQAEIVMHRTRTEATSVHFRFRAWSHRWLTERNLPSGLPDMLRPKAERMYPRVVEGVGISVNFRSSILKPAATEIRTAMEAEVEDAYAHGRTEPGFVKARMEEARARTLKALFG